jgi:protein TonB
MSATIIETLSVDKAGNIVRLVIGITLGLAVTAGLFWFMQYLIVTADRDLNEGASGHLVDFVRLKRDESIQRRQLKPKKPPPPDAPPPQPPTPQLDNLDPNAEKIAISAAPVETDIEMSGGLSTAGAFTQYRRLLRGSVHGYQERDHS